MPTRAAVPKTRPAATPAARSMVALLVSASCVRPAGGAPPALDDTRTVLVLNLIEATEGRPHSTLVIEGHRSAFTTATPADTVVLTYPYAPSQLGFRPGPMTLRPGGPDLCGPQLRPLPAPAQAFGLDEAGDWSALADEPRLAALCVPEPSMVECFAAGGCYRTLPLSSAPFCDLGCQSPPRPTLPSPPLAPAPPLAPDLDCPSTDPTCALRDELCQGPSPPPAYASWYCRHRNSSCAAGPFAPPPPGTTPVYVDAQATGPGDGTLNAPYPDLNTALERHPGAPVLLAPGDHAAPPSLPAGLQLIGACARPTHLIGRLDAVGALTLEGLTIDGPLEVDEAILRDVRVTARVGAQEPLLRATRTLVLEGVSLEGPATLGLDLGPGSRAQVTGLVSTELNGLARIEGGALEVDGWHHHGDLASGFGGYAGAELLLRRLILERVEETGLELWASSASVSDALIATRLRPAIALAEQASAHLQRVVLTTEAVGTIEARRSVLRGSDLHLDNPRSEAPALYAETSTLALERVRIRCGLKGAVLRASEDQRSQATIRDLDAERVAPCDPDAFGGMIFLEPNGSLRLERAALREGKFGLWIGAHASVQAQDVEIGRSPPSCRGDNGVSVEAGGALEIERVRLYNLADHGLLSQGDASALRMTDLELIGVDDSLATTEAIALNLSGRQGPMQIQRAWIHGRFGPVLRLGAATDLRVQDLTLEQRGFDVVAELNEQASLAFSRLLLEGHSGPGLITGNNSTFTLHEGVIRGLSPGLQTPTEPDRRRLEGLRFEDTPCAYEARDEVTQCR